MDPNPRPPDGGYGWVIVGCSFVIHMLNIGFMISLSFFYVSWLEEFGQSKSMTSWIISLGTAATFILAPIPARLVDKLGHRTIMMIGGLLTSAGYILAFFATSVPYLIFCIGVLTGIGTSFTYLPCIVIIGMYFEKKRSLAMGIGSCGVGFGAIIASPLMNALTNEYGWRGCFLIIGALSLHQCVVQVVALLMRVPRQEMNRIVIRVDGADVVDGVSDIEWKGNEKNVDSNRSSVLLNDEFPVGDDGPNENNVNNGVHLLHEEMPTSGKFSLLHNKPLEALRCGGSVQQLSSPSFVSNGQLRPYISLEGLNPTMPRKRLLQGQGQHQESTSLRDILTRSLMNFDIVLLGSTRSISIATKGLTDGEETVSMTLEFHGRPEASLDNNIIQNPTFTNKYNRMFYSCLRCPMLRSNIELFKSRTFCLLALNNLLINLSYLTPLVYLVDRAIDNGIDKSVGTLLISLNGGGNLIGRFLCGFLVNRFQLDSLTVVIVLQSTCGFITMASPLCGDVVFLHATYVTCFGALIGSCVTMAPVMAMDLLDTSRMAESFGMILTFVGTGVLVGPPIGGAVFDWTQNYTICYIVSGLFLVTSACILLPVMLSRRCACMSSSGQPKNN